MARQKQCEIKKRETLVLFGKNMIINLNVGLSVFSLENSDIKYPFVGHNAKNKITNFQLKISLLDFRLVKRCSLTTEFQDLGISCRSNPLLEGKNKKISY